MNILLKMCIVFTNFFNSVNTIINVIFLKILGTSWGNLTFFFVRIKKMYNLRLEGSMNSM